MISVTDTDLLDFIQGVIQDIKFLQSECLQAAHGHAPNGAFRAAHVKYELLIAEIRDRIATGSEEPIGAEAASLVPTSSPSEPSESGGEAPPSV